MASEALGPIRLASGGDCYGCTSDRIVGTTFFPIKSQRRGVGCGAPQWPTYLRARPSTLHGAVNRPGSILRNSPPRPSQVGPNALVKAPGVSRTACLVAAVSQ